MYRVMRIDIPIFLMYIAMVIHFNIYTKPYDYLNSCNTRYIGMLLDKGNVGYYNKANFHII